MTPEDLQKFQRSLKGKSMNEIKPLLEAFRQKHNLDRVTYERKTVHTVTRTSRTTLS